jgi:hypothetical protein
MIMAGHRRFLPSIFRFDIFVLYYRAANSNPLAACAFVDQLETIPSSQEGSCFHDYVFSVIVFWSPAVAQSWRYGGKVDRSAWQSGSF